MKLGDNSKVEPAYPRSLQHCHLKCFQGKSMYFLWQYYKQRCLDWMLHL